MIREHKNRTQIIHLFLCTVFILLVVGIVAVYSASSVFALTYYASAHYFLKRHCIGIALGIVSFIGIQCVPINIIRLAAPSLFWMSLGLTALALFPNLSYLIHGSRRWLAIGGFSFQPSELLKVALPLYIASLLDSAYHKNTPHNITYIMLSILVGCTSVILLLQPDFGLTITLLLTLLAILFVAQFNVRHISYLLGGLTIASAMLIALRPYRIRRLLTFLNPWSDPQGAGFQIIQSLIAIGNGHWTGIGIAHSKQKFFYLPMQHTDFIFAIIAEETGFIGCFFIISIYCILVYTGLWLATKVHTLFKQLTIAGYTTLIGLQTIINMAVTIGLAPTKGIGLPFISYGNTALVCFCIIVGIITLFAREP